MKPTAKPSCPFCASQLERGTCEVKGTVAGFLLWGFSSQHLWFRGERKKLKVIASSGEADGFRCSKCGAIVIQPQKGMLEGIAEALDKPS